MSGELAELVYQSLRSEISTLSTTVQDTASPENALLCDGVPAYDLVDLPVLADGGLGDGVSNITIAWCTNGRKSGEGVGAGTGQLVYYNPATDQWLRIRDDSVITA